MTTTTDQLTGVERDILDFERAWWKYVGAKETEVLRRFGHSMTRHYQLLNVLLDRPAALAHDPLVVRRLARLRDARHQQRTRRVRHLSEQGDFRA